MWTQDDSGRVHTPFEPVVLAATLALIPVLIKLTVDPERLAGMLDRLLVGLPTLRCIEDLKLLPLHPNESEVGLPGAGLSPSTGQGHARRISAPQVPHLLEASWG